MVFLVLQSPFNHEIQQDSQASYGQSVRPPLDAVQQTVVSGSYVYEQQRHAAAARVHQPTSSPSPDHHMHSGQQVPACRPMYMSTVPSAMSQGQPALTSYSQPAVSLYLLVDIVDTTSVYLH